VKARALRVEYFRPGFAASLVLVTAAYLVMGLAAGIAWRFTGDDSWLKGYFEVPAALLAAFLGAVQLWSSYKVLRRFEPDEAMYPAWLCISGSAAFNLSGVLLRQVLSVESRINPLAGSSSWSPALASCLERFGHLLGGTGRFALLSAGLWMVLGVYRKQGLVARLKAIDWAFGALAAAYVVRDLVDMVAASKYRSLDAVELISGATDPLLLLLLVVCALLYRSNRRMGAGAISRCWNAFALGIVLVSIGVGARWAVNWGYLPWPYDSLFWYVWLPADAAFALAPVYQLQAMDQASLALQPGRAN
jgi:hypothetical protein